MVTTTEEVLRFIARNGCVTYQELANIFNRTENWSNKKLSKLKKQKLVTNEPKCHWQLTYYGERRLAFYNRRRDKGNQ